VSDVVALAAKAAEILIGRGNGDDLNVLADEDEEIDAVRDDSGFLKALDTIAFQCPGCGFWFRQRENATPNGAEWRCQECV